LSGHPGHGVQHRRECRTDAGHIQPRVCCFSGLFHMALFCWCFLCVSVPLVVVLVLVLVLCVHTSMNCHPHDLEVMRWNFHMRHVLVASGWAFVRPSHCVFNCRSPAGMSCVCAQAGAARSGHRQHRGSDNTMHHSGHGCGSVSWAEVWLRSSVDQSTCCGCSSSRILQTGSLAAGRVHPCGVTLRSCAGRVYCTCCRHCAGVALGWAAPCLNAEVVSSFCILRQPQDLHAHVICLHPVCFP
jgi:hypothetical protein